MEVPTRLVGRNAIVTGAAGGLGRAIAERLAAEGAAVALLDLHGEEEAAATIGGSARGWRCDVTEREEVGRVVDEVAATFGGVDILVNNVLACSRDAVPSSRVDKEEMLRYFTTNAVGYLHMAQACFPHLTGSEHRGRIVNVASRTFFTGSPGQIAYVASKGRFLASPAPSLRSWATRTSRSQRWMVPSQVGDSPVPGGALRAGDVRSPRCASRSSRSSFAPRTSRRSSPSSSLTTGG